MRRADARLVHPGICSSRKLASNLSSTTPRKESASKVHLLPRTPAMRVAGSACPAAAAAGPLLFALTLSSLLAGAVQASTLPPSAAARRHLSRSSSSQELASRASAPAGPISLPLHRRAPSLQDEENDDAFDPIAWAGAQANALRLKYGVSDPPAQQEPTTSTSKRDALAASSSMKNYNADTSFFTTISIGTPGQDFSVILDTGSSDTWISSAYFQPSKSSSFLNTNLPFNIQYGGGTVAGTLGTDEMLLANHIVTNQTFAVANTVSGGLLNGQVQGIMGMAFQALSASGQNPLWYGANLQDNTFACEYSSFLLLFYSFSSKKDRSHRNLPDYFERNSNASETIAPGGLFTFGGANASLYQGSINWVDVIQPKFWLITLGGVTASGKTIDLKGELRAAIDTGTTLIGGPNDIVQAFYAAIPGSGPIASQPGFYSYQCDTQVGATMQFGNQKYTIAEEALAVQQIGAGYCMGAFFGLGNTAGNDAQWIIGTNFLSSVYT